MQCFKCATPLPDGSRFCNGCGADVSAASGGGQMQAMDADPQLRERLQEDVGADFVVGNELGRGGMAIVYQARDAHLGRKVAIKILPPELTFGRGLVERFKREARTAATLDHPHIIPIFRVSTGGKLFWYVMKFLEGESLADRVRREGAQPFDVTVDVVEQVADALQYAHDHGVVHRDVKPANVMLDERGWVTVTDFGIAKAASEQSMTGSGSMIGTPYYMSPEQCSGKKVTGAADQYSLGIMAYEMLSGQLPFTGDSTFDIIKQHCMDPVPPLSEVSPHVPVPMVAVMERALAKAPESRFATVLDFAAALYEAWGEGSASTGVHAEHKSVTGRTTRRGPAANTPRTPRPSVTLDVSAVPPVPTEVLAPPAATPPASALEPPKPAPEPPTRPGPAPEEFATQAMQLAPPRAPEPAPATPAAARPPALAPEPPRHPEPAAQEMATQAMELEPPPALARPEPDAPKASPPAIEPPALASKPVPPTPAPETAAPPSPEPLRQGPPRRPAPSPAARPRPAPFALLVEQETKRKPIVPMAIAAAVVLVIGVFGAWKAVASRGTPVATGDSATATVPRPPSDSAKAPGTSSPRATRATVAPSPPRGAFTAGGTATFVVANLPPGAELRFDGLLVTSSSWRTRAGVPHELVLSATGYEPWSGTYTPWANETQRIDFRRALQRAH